MKKSRELMFSVTIKDCRVETCRGGGAGGQNRNKRDTAVRIVHPPSGAVGESREARTQFENKKRAFGRMARSEAFRKWNRIEAARHAGWDIEAIVDREMRPENLKVELGVEVSE